MNYGVQGSKYSMRCRYKFLSGRYYDLDPDVNPKIPE